MAGDFECLNVNAEEATGVRGNPNMARLILRKVQYSIDIWQAIYVRDEVGKLICRWIKTSETVFVT